MKLEEFIQKLENLSLNERTALANKEAEVYYNFCSVNGGSEDAAKTLFFGSLATIIGIDLTIDEKEFHFFQTIIDGTELTFEMFTQYVKAWTNVKTIEDTDYLIDNFAGKDAKDAFVILCILFAIANDELQKAELGLIAKYVQ